MNTSAEYRFSAADAEFGEILAHSSQSDGARFGDVSELARSSASGGFGGERAEFLDLVEKAKTLWP